MEGAVLEGFGLRPARRDVAKGGNVQRSALQLDLAQETLQGKGGPVRSPSDRLLRRGRSLLSRGQKPAAQLGGEFALLGGVDQARAFLAADLVRGIAERLRRRRMQRVDD